MKKFCYRCGKITDDLKDGLCSECRRELENENKELERKVIEIIICPRCGRIKKDGKWEYDDVEELKSKYKSEGFEVREKYRICEDCLKISSGYHESVLQLRGFNKEETMKVEEIFYSSGEKFFSKEEKHGKDFYFLRKKSAEKMAKKIQKMFKNVEIKKSYKLITVKDGKRVYRNYVSVRKNEEETGNK